jgi:D-3-phosphoglycerate dehydrogenase / 2-oxoglutarate reductase
VQGAVAGRDDRRGAASEPSFRRGGRGRRRHADALGPPARPGRGRSLSHDPVAIVVPDDYPSVFHGTDAHRRLETLGQVAIYTERGADREDELIGRLGQARVAINIRAHARFTERVLTACPALELISVWGTGVDNIDLGAAARSGVTVVNIPGVNANAVAEHALALTLAVAHRTAVLDREVRAGRWPREVVTQLLGKTLGVFGLGATGSRMVTLGRVLGMDVLAWSALGDSGRTEAAGARPASKEAILTTADVISLHLRLSPATRGFLGRDELALMRPQAILINTARAGLVDRAALLDALCEERIFGAGLDVFDHEPVAADDPLLGLPNVVLSPHIAGTTPEVIREGLLRVVANVENYLAGSATDVVRVG